MRLVGGLTPAGANARRHRTAAILVAAAAIGMLVGGCSDNANSSSLNSGNMGDSSGCTELLADARNYVQSEQTGDGRLDWTLEEMAYRCSSEYDTFIDEISGAVNQDGTTKVRQTPATGPTGATSWSEAANYVGSTRYVCGPLVNSGASGDDVFLNLGRGYPDPGRFTIVLWDIGGIESLPKDTMLCATGTITLYQGTAQMELRSTDAVEVWE